MAVVVVIPLVTVLMLTSVVTSVVVEEASVVNAETVVVLICVGVDSTKDVVPSTKLQKMFHSIYNASSIKLLKASDGKSTAIVVERTKSLR